MVSQNHIHSTYGTKSILLPVKDASGMYFAQVVLGASGLHSEVLYTTQQHRSAKLAIADCESWLGIDAITDAAIDLDSRIR